ncbi:MAG TPA: hypothetical protein VMV49_01440, partial [Candidatus Deferrimicrobium sp.]|nr:hypothetical protein [Candidatus Deferrimicrobium sp.]
FEGLPAYAVLGVGAGDIRNNSKDEVLFLNNLGDLYVFDGETNERLKKISPLGDMVVFGGGKNKGFDINFGDIDNNGVMEFVVSGINEGGTNGSTCLYRWQNDDLVKVWEFTLNSSAYCSTAALGDVNGDGKAESIVGSRQNGISAGGRMFLLNGETKEVLWEFDTGSNNIYDISCGDLRNDGRDEIAVAVGGTLNYTYILEGENNSILWGIPSEYEVNGVELADINTDGKCEIIIIANNTVTLYCIDTDGDGLSDIDDLDDDNDNLTDFQEVILFKTNQFLIDSDHDNISDTAELFAYGTNPTWRDTDNDNLTDWQEIFYFHTNATNPNTDGDYLTDGEDVELGLDPTDPDTYNDGFPDSWAYFLDEDLDNLTNFQEINIYFTFPNNPDTDHDNLTDWEEIIKYNTNATNPNTDGDYLTDGEDVELGLDPTDPDTYNDGFPDSWAYFLDDDLDNLTNFQEINIYFTFPNNPDTDHDNLTDWQEIIIYNTSATNPNTDGDLLTDWEELYIYKTDPNNPDSDGDGYLDGAALPGRPQYDWLFYLLIALVSAIAAVLTINLRYFFRFQREEYWERTGKKKAETIRKILKEAIWFWGHGSTVLKNFDKLVANNITTITIEALTRTWTQHYKKSFQKIFDLTEEEAIERAEDQKKKDILELYNLIQDKIDVKKVPITFGKYVGSESYQFEISESEIETKSTQEVKISKNLKSGTKNE